MEELKEVGTTLIAGSLALIVAEAAFYFVLGTRLTGFFAPPFGVHKVRDAQLFLFLCFAIGLMAEDILHKSSNAIDLGGQPQQLLCTDRWFDDLQYDRDDVTFQNGRYVKGLTRKRLVTVVLVGGLDSGSPHVQPLGDDLADSNIFTTVDGGNRGAKVNDWILGKRDTHGPTPKDIENAIQHVWYEAKNRVFQVEGYRDELTRIETRQRFTLTLAETAHVFWEFVVPPGGALAVIFLTVVSISPQWNSWRKYLPSHSNVLVNWAIRAQQSRKIIFLHAARIIVCWACLYVVYFVGFWSHTRESIDFNKRVFGYYRSLVFETSNPIAKDGALEVPKTVSAEGLSAGRSANSRSVAASH